MCLSGRLHPAAVVVIAPRDRHRQEQCSNQREFPHMRHSLRYEDALRALNLPNRAAQ
jgi:hypothetical protein